MAKKWKLQHRTLQLESKWVTVYSDRLIDDSGQELEYWHYDRPDSVVVIAVFGDSLVLPPPQYRVGVDEIMLDFAGSRIVSGKSPIESAKIVIERELGVKEKSIEKLQPINEKPYAVDSSFSSQKLWGFTAYIKRDARLSDTLNFFSLSKSEDLRKKLRCGQCRLLLDEFILNQKS